MQQSKSSNKKILVVEDEPAIGQICRRVLETPEFTVDITSNGKLAQGMIKKKSYDLLIFDIKLPLVNGRELYQWLREEYPEMAQRVLFMTGDLMSGNTKEFLEQTGRQFLPKPFTPKELKTIVDKVLQEKQ